MGKKRLLKTLVFVLKWRKLAKEKPGKSYQPEVARVEFKGGGDLIGYEKPAWSASGIEM